MSINEQRNIALLIDSDNASPAGIDPVLTVLAELGQVNIRRAYGNWRKASLKGRLKHVTGNARVLADEHTPTLGHQHLGCCTSES